jgi:hypothetical protein
MDAFEEMGTTVDTLQTPAHVVGEGRKGCVLCVLTLLLQWVCTSLAM